MCDKDWDVEKYREDHESEEQWGLRRTFLETWKNEYPEDRLLCLAQVFINMEFLGCKYPRKLMKRVTSMSNKLAISYRQAKERRLKRTFVSASEAAEDRAKGTKRQCGIVIDEAKKQNPISFVKEGNIVEEPHSPEKDDNEVVEEKIPHVKKSYSDEKNNNYLREMQSIKCIDLKNFKTSMFNTIYGKMVLIVRPWTSRMHNICMMCESCNIRREVVHDDGCVSLYLNRVLVAESRASNKSEAKQTIEKLAWMKLREECIIIVMKELIVSHGKSITSYDITGQKSMEELFGTPVDNTVAVKMMKLMGWKGGGLGLDQQGIAEPIRPNLQLVRKAGLGSTTKDKRQLRRAAKDLMMRFKLSEGFDVDLVFAADFTKDEREVLHVAARSCQLMSKSYGKDADRFLVVKKRPPDPFTLACQIIEKGGVTPKYQIFIPEKLLNKN